MVNLIEAELDGVSFQRKISFFSLHSATVLIFFQITASEGLRTRKEQWTAQETKSIIGTLKRLTCFKDYKFSKDLDYIELGEQLTLRAMQQNFVEWRIDEPINKFNIVLKGTCSRWLPVPRAQMLGPILELKRAFLDSPYASE